MFCLAKQDELGETFRLEGRGPRFRKRKGVKSIQRCYNVFKKEFPDLDLTSRTKAKKEQATYELSCSIVGKALADIPLDVITPETMHVILGLTKKIYEWLLKLFCKLEALEEEATVGSTTYQFCQAIVEARDSATDYATTHHPQDAVPVRNRHHRRKEGRKFQANERNWEGNQTYGNG